MHDAGVDPQRLGDLEDAVTLTKLYAWLLVSTNDCASTPVVERSAREDGTRISCPKSFPASCLACVKVGRSGRI